MNPCCAADSNSASLELLSFKIDVLKQDDLNRIAAGSIERDEKTVLGHHNLHSLYLCQKLPKMKSFYERADYIHIDGMSVVLLGRLLGFNLTKENRLTSLDWLLPLLDHCQGLIEERLRVFMLGGQPGVAETAREVFMERIKNMEVRHHHGYFDMNDELQNGSVVDAINAFRPHLLLVGMGMPRQEEWIAANRDLLDANIIWSLGAFMDYYAGVIPLPPRWLGRIGLEWAFRLVTEPRRLWRRYLVEPWLVLSLLVKELVTKGGLAKGNLR